MMTSKVPKPMYMRVLSAAGMARVCAPNSDFSNIDVTGGRPRLVAEDHPSRRTPGPIGSKSLRPRSPYYADVSATRLGTVHNG